MKKYIVELTPEERSELKQIIDASRMAAHKRRHAWMLLKADQGEHGPGWTDTRVAEAFDAGLLINAPRPDTLRFMPALNVTRDEINQMIGILRKSLMQERIERQRSQRRNWK